MKLREALPEPQASRIRNLRPDMEWQRLIPERNDSSGMLRACGFKHSRHSLCTQAVSRRETVTGSQVRVQRWPASHMSELRRKVGPPHTCRARRTPGQAGSVDFAQDTSQKAVSLACFDCVCPFVPGASKHANPSAVPNIFPARVLDSRSLCLAGRLWVSSVRFFAPGASLSQQF